MIVTATPHPDRALVTVALAPDAGAHAAIAYPVVVTRSAAGGPPVPVRNGDPMPDGADQLDDLEAPFGVPLLYRATDNAGQVFTAAAQLDSDRPRLDHPGLQSLGVWARIVDDQPPAWESGTAVHQIIGRRDPITVAQPLRTRAGTLTLAVADLPELDQLLALLASGLPVLLRTPCSDLFRDGWLAVTQVADAHTSARAPQRAVELQYVEVARPQGPSQGTPGWVYRDAATLFGTYAELDAAFGTYAELAAGPIP